MSALSAEAETASDPMEEASTRVELDLHSIDGALDHIRRSVQRDPWLAGAYREDFAQLAAEFGALSDHSKFNA